MAGSDERAAAFGMEEVRAVADLARLALTDAEAATFARDLGRVLEAAQALAALDVEGVDPAYRVGAGAEDPALARGPGAAQARLRADEPGACLDRDAVLAMAPDRDEAFFRVPTVVERT